MRIDMHRRDTNAFITPEVMQEFDLTYERVTRTVAVEFPTQTAEGFADWLIDQGADAARAGKATAGKRMCAYGDAIRYRLGLPT
jgi:hypothetical protein